MFLTFIEKAIGETKVNNSCPELDDIKKILNPFSSPTYWVKLIILPAVKLSICSQYN